MGVEEFLTLVEAFLVLVEEFLTLVKEFLRLVVEFLTLVATFLAQFAMFLTQVKAFLARIADLLELDRERYYLLTQAAAWIWDRQVIQSKWPCWLAATILSTAAKCLAAFGLLGGSFLYKQFL